MWEEGKWVGVEGPMLHHYMVKRNLLRKYEKGHNGHTSQSTPGGTGALLAWDLVCSLVKESLQTHTTHPFLPNPTTTLVQVFSKY